jgi:hypothetical protein
MTAPAIGPPTQAQRRPGAGRRLAAPLTSKINVSGAQAVTLARGGITSWHHGDRQTVLEAVTKRLQDAFLPPDPGGREGRAWLLASSGAYVMLTHSHPRLARIASHAVEALSSEPELRPALKAHGEHIRLAVADAVRAGKRDGGVRVPADAAAQA